MAAAIRSPSASVRTTSCAWNWPTPAANGPNAGIDGAAPAPPPGPKVRPSTSNHSRPSFIVLSKSIPEQGEPNWVMKGNEPNVVASGTISRLGLPLTTVVEKRARSKRPLPTCAGPKYPMWYSVALP